MNTHSNLFKQAQLIIEFLGIWMTLKFKCTFCTRSSVIWVSLFLTRICHYHNIYRLHLLCKHINILENVVFALVILFNISLEIPLQFLAYFPFCVNLLWSKKSCKIEAGHLLLVWHHQMNIMVDYIVNAFVIHSFLFLVRYTFG